MKLLYTDCYVCVRIPSVLLGEVCVIAARRVLPKQRLGGELRPFEDNNTEKSSVDFSLIYHASDTL